MFGWFFVAIFCDCVLSLGITNILKCPILLMHILEHFSIQSHWIDLRILDMLEFLSNYWLTH